MEELTRKEIELIINILEEQKKTLFCQILPLKGYLRSGGKDESYIREYEKKLDKITEIEKIIIKIKIEEVL